MQLIATAKSLDVATWFRGLISAGVSGFFSVLAGAIVLPSLDSHHFNIFTVDYYIALGALGGTSALVSVSKFLSATPLPDYKQVEKTTQIVTQDNQPAKIIETTKETSVEKKEQ